MPMDLYYKIKEQRKSTPAPVDTIGCASVGAGMPTEVRKFNILVALLLSSQTKDEITYDAIARLNGLLGQLTPETVCDEKPQKIHECIRRVGYHNRKLEYLLEISRLLKDRGMPATLEELLKLRGVGKKMAYLYLQHACGKSLGIGVDTHVFRISRRLGLSEAETPEGVRKDLERCCDKDEWSALNTVLVGFGQMVCHAVKPKCAECCVKDECPSRQLS